jgi:hypothetical protein
MVRVHLVDKYGAVLATMTGEIAWRIANNIELAHRSSVRTGDFQIKV